MTPKQSVPTDPDLFRSRLDQIIDMDRPLIRVIRAASTIDTGADSFASTLEIAVSALFAAKGDDLSPA